MKSSNSCTTLSLNESNANILKASLTWTIKMFVNKVVCLLVTGRKSTMSPESNLMINYLHFVEVDPTYWIPHTLLHNKQTTLIENTLLVVFDIKILPGHNHSLCIVQFHILNVTYIHTYTYIYTYSFLFLNVAK